MQAENATKKKKITGAGRRGRGGYVWGGVRERERERVRNILPSQKRLVIRARISPLLEEKQADSFYCLCFQFLPSSLSSFLQCHKQKRAGAAEVGESQKYNYFII